MRFLYLLFIFFNLTIVSQRSSSVSADFNQAGCQGSSLADEICSETVGEAKELKVEDNRLKLGDKDVTNQVIQEADGRLTFQGKEVGRYGSTENSGTIRNFTSGFSTPLIPVSGDINPVKEGASCEVQKEDATSCCNDPVTCLGGEHLSTFNQVNNIATQVGPGLSMLMQGTGKDMSGMCEALQAMAGAGAGLSTAALAKCKGSISACHSSCDKSIKRSCEIYVQAKLDCNRNINLPMVDKPSVEQSFAAIAETPAKRIVKHKRVIKPACDALNAKATEIIGNLGQMANSALSAELCKKQASAGKDKEECAKAGGRWDGYRCITPEGECEKQDGIWDGKKCKSQQQVCVEKGSDWRWNNVECVNRQEECEEAQQKGVAVSWDPLANLGKGACRKTDQTQATVNRGDGSGDISDQYGGGINLNTETPGTNDEYDPDDPDNNAVGGGGSTPAGISSGGSPGSSDLLSGLKSSGTNPKAASPTNTAAGKGKRYSGGGRMGGFGRGFRGRRSGERASSGSDKDKPGLSMGGGGFSGYGGGSGDGDDSYASLGLSKKKLKELEKKAGAKRKAASEGLGGAHQNIFERITKRFQSLCKNKLDCR